MWKLFFSCLLIGIIPLVIFSVAASRSMADTFLKLRRDALSTHAIVAAGTVGRSNYIFDESIRPLVNSDIEEKSRENSYRILIFDDTSFCVSDTNRLETGMVLAVPEVINALSGVDSQSVQPFGDVMYAASPVKNESSQIIGAVLIVSSIGEIFEPIADIETRLIYFAAMIFIFTAFFVYFTSRIFIKPIRSIMASVRRMSQGHLNVRTEITGRDEFSEMGQAFNVMAEKLELVEKTREEFVSDVSHELKTPLSSIKVLSESILLQDEVPPEMYVEFLMDINSEVDRMTSIVNDLLTLVKLDRREISLDFAPADLNKMAMDILRRLLPLAKRKGIKIMLEEIKNVTADADEMKLSMAISNLAENAIKYTPDGGTVKVILDSDYQNAFITVSDTGIGIDEENQSKIFTRFYRVDKTRDRETGGTGLGLSITHKTALLHNGSIRVSSIENEGSTFTVRIPLHQ